MAETAAPPSAPLAAAEVVAPNSEPAEPGFGTAMRPVGRAGRARIGDFNRAATGQDIGVAEPVEAPEPAPRSQGLTRATENMGAKGHELAERREQQEWQTQQRESGDAEPSESEEAVYPEGEGALDVLSSADANAEWRTRLKQLDEWEASDDVPEPFMQKFGYTTVNGQKYRVTVAEAFRSHMRQSDYSQKLAELRQMRDSLTSQQAGINRLLDMFDNGTTFLEAVEHLGKFNGFAQAAMIFGKQLDVERRLDPNQRALMQRQRQLEAENRKLMNERANLQRQVQEQVQQVPTQDETYFLSLMNTMIENAGRRMATKGRPWVDSPATRRAFEEHWAANLHRLDGQEPSTAFVEEIMSGVMEYIGELESHGYIQRAAPAAQKLLPPVNKLSQAPAQQMTAQGVPQQKVNGRVHRERIGDFGRTVNRP